MLQINKLKANMILRVQVSELNQVIEVSFYLEWNISISLPGSNPFELISSAQIKPPPPPQQLQPPPPEQLVTGYEKQFFSNEFYSVMQEMI